MQVLTLRRYFHSALALAWLCLPGVGRTDYPMPIAPFEASYKVYLAGIAVGQAELQLEYQGDSHYRMRSSLHPVGVAGLFAKEGVDEEVEGELVAGTPRPLTYRAKRTGSKARTVSLNFDWDRGEVKTEVSGKAGRLALGPRMVDPLTLFLLTMLDLRSGALAGEYGVIDRDRLKTYRTQMLEEAKTATSIGELATLAISRQRPDSSKATKLWHAPALGFLPVQVSRTKDGTETSRLTIERLTR
jgi:hypothetical protein